MTSMGKREDFVDHGLHPDFHGLYIIFFEQGENFFIQGIGRVEMRMEWIRRKRGEVGLLLDNEPDHLLGLRWSFPIKSNLFFPISFAKRNYGKRGFDKFRSEESEGIPSGDAFWLQKRHCSRQPIAGRNTGMIKGVILLYAKFQNPNVKWSSKFKCQNSIGFLEIWNFVI